VTRSRLRQPTAYGAAVVLSALALQGTLWLGPMAARNQLGLFAAAVVVSAWFGGLGPGLVATVLGALAANYFFAEPLHTFGVKEPRDVVGLLAFAGMAALASGLSANLRRSRERAEAAARVRDLLLASLSHDLKHPLTAIKGQAQLLRRRLDQLGVAQTEPIAERLDRLDAAAKRMAEMIDELIDLARGDAGEALELQRQSTDLVALALASAEEQRQASTVHTIQVEHGAPVHGCWDQRRLERVLGNLLNNAVKFTPDGGTIVVSVERDQTGRWAMLRVRDQGIGIPAADLPSVFEPFRRGANVGARGGRGVGLAGVRQIVDAHGGTVAVSSREGAGTTVEVRLPLDPA
jgi:signal transduction histidine kinase